MIKLRELGPNDSCFCGSGKKLKKCCNKRGYWVGPNVVVPNNIRRASGGMELLTIASECGTKVTPDMGILDIFRALPPEHRASALLDTYSITLPARIYDERTMILGGMDYAWFLYSQNIPYVSSVHDPEGFTPEKLQLAAETASRWLWNECGRDGDPPKFATVENVNFSMRVDGDFDTHMRTTETIRTLLDPENKSKAMVMWILGRLVHRAFGQLFREAPVGPNRLSCQCERCATRPHPKSCNCTYCANIEKINAGVVVLRSDPIEGRPIHSDFIIRPVSAAEAAQALAALGRTIVIYNPDAARERLNEAFEAATNGQTDKARVLLKQLRIEAEEAVATLVPYADRTYSEAGVEGRAVCELIDKFKSMDAHFENLEKLLENTP